MTFYCYINLSQMKIEMKIKGIISLVLSIDDDQISTCV